MTTSICRIAIVDDDPRVLSSLANLVASLGYCPCPFPSASDMIAANILPQVRCIIADRDMPITGGLELLELTKRARLPIPVIIVTGEAGQEVESVYIDRGAAGFLRKPIDCNALSVLLEQC